MTMRNHCNKHVSTSCVAAHASSTHLCFQSQSGISGTKCQSCIKPRGHSGYYTKAGRARFFLSFTC